MYHHLQKRIYKEVKLLVNKCKDIFIIRLLNSSIRGWLVGLSVCLSVKKKI